MKLLANENFPLRSIEIVAMAGYDIIGIGIDNFGIRDDEVIDLAENDNRTILTFDKDYGELIFKLGRKPTAGVIYLRWDSYRPNEPGEYLIKLFKSKEIQFEGMLTVISENSIRQRKYV